MSFPPPTGSPAQAPKGPQVPAWLVTPRASRIGLTIVALIILAPIVTGLWVGFRYLTVADGPYAAAPEVCDVMTGPQIKTLVGRTPGEATLEKHRNSKRGPRVERWGCRWRPAGDKSLAGDVYVSTVVWESDTRSGVDKADEDFDDDRESALREARAENDLCDRVTGVKDEAFLTFHRYGERWYSFIASVRDGNAVVDIKLSPRIPAKQGPVDEAQARKLWEEHVPVIRQLAEDLLEDTRRT